MTQKYFADLLCQCFKSRSCVNLGRAVLRLLSSAKQCDDFICTPCGTACMQFFENDVPAYLELPKLSH